jgi:hypothetical protein
MTQRYFEHPLKVVTHFSVFSFRLLNGIKADFRFKYFGSACINHLKMPFRQSNGHFSQSSAISLVFAFDLNLIQSCRANRRISVTHFFIFTLGHLKNRHKKRSSIDDLNIPDTLQQQLT